MFGTAKPAASLSSGLLARKGQARPAMRPQGFVGLEPGTSLDDLGWNDMGHDVSRETEAVQTVPPVLAQRRVLAEEFEPPVAPRVEVQAQDVPEPVSAPMPAPLVDQATSGDTKPTRRVSNATAARIGREVSARKGKAAFTLRLDTQRHLQLRLASAVSGRSAQQLVTEALDAFLETLPEIGALADQLPTGKAR